MRAFTLFDILISVVVVTLLLSMLLPALAGARERTRDVQCVANCRQVAVAWLDYASTQRAMPRSAQFDNEVLACPKSIWKYDYLWDGRPRLLPRVLDDARWPLVWDRFDRTPPHRGKCGLAHSDGSGTLFEPSDIVPLMHTLLD